MPVKRFRQLGRRGPDDGVKDPRLRVKLVLNKSRLPIADARLGNVSPCL